MNTEYKQWKSILASKKFLIPLGLVGGLFLIPLVIFVNNLVGYFYRWGLMNVSALKNKESLLSFKPKFSLSFFFLPKWINSIHLILFLLLFVVVVWKFVKTLYRMRISYANLNKGSKGTQQFTKLNEIKKQYPCVKMDDQEYEGLSGVPIICYDGYIYYDPANTNSEAIGSSQSGKTQGHTYPMMDLGMRAKIKDSFLVLDVKGNMIRLTKAEWERFGFDVYCMNLIDPDNGISYNPLELIKQAYLKKDFGKAQLLAQTFSYSIYNDPQAKDKFWQDTSIALLNALILAVCDIAIAKENMNYVTLYSVAMMLITLSANPDEKGKTGLDYYFENLPMNNPARMQFSVIEKSAGVTRSGIYTSMQAKLAPFLNEKIARMTASSTFDLLDLANGKKPIALFMVVPDYDESNYALVSTFISQVNFILAEEATSSASGKLNRRVRRLFEEIANVPAIEGLSRAMNVDLERGVLTHIIVQSHAQLTDKYGEFLAKAITGACGNKFYIMSDNLDDASEFSEFLGDKTIIAPDRHGDPLSLDKSFGESEDGRRLLDTNEIRGIHEGEWVLIRTKKRKNLDGHHIVPRPIFANRKEKTNFLYAYEYLGERFASDKKLSEFQLGDGHDSLDLETLIIPAVVQSVPTTSDAYDEVGDTYEYDNDPNNPENYEPNDSFQKESREVEEVSNDIEAVSEKETLLIEALSKEKRDMLYQLAKRGLEEGEYHYFSKLETIEEINSFLSSKDRKDLKENIDEFVFS